MDKPIISETNQKLKEVVSIGLPTEKPKPIIKYDYERPDPSEFHYQEYLDTGVN